MSPFEGGGQSVLLGTTHTWIQSETIFTHLPHGGLICINAYQYGSNAYQYVYMLVHTAHTQYALG